MYDIGSTSGRLMFHLFLNQGSIQASPVRTPTELGQTSTANMLKEIPKSGKCYSVHVQYVTLEHVHIIYTK